MLRLKESLLVQVCDVCSTSAKTEEFQIKPWG